MAQVHMQENVVVSHVGGPELAVDIFRAADVIKTASPISYARQAYPPTLLIHGTTDPRVPHGMTVRLYQALEQVGVPVELLLYAGQDHLFDQEPQFCAAIAEAMTFFISPYVSLSVAVTAS